MNNLTTTIFIFTYNQEEYIEECLSSIFKQTVLPDQIVVNDDCSNDNTKNLIYEVFNNHKLIIEKNDISILINCNEKNIGLNPSKNIIMSHGKGDVFIMGAGDDVFLPNRVEVVLDIFNQDINCFGVFTNLQVIDKLGCTNDELLFTKKPNFASSKKDVFWGSPVWCIGASSAFRKEVFLNFESTPFSHISSDGVAAFRSLLLGKMKFSNIVTVLYRHHDNNLSQNLTTEKKIAYYSSKHKYCYELINNSLSKNYFLITPMLFLKFLFWRIVSLLLKFFKYTFHKRFFES